MRGPQGARRCSCASRCRPRRRTQPSGARSRARLRRVDHRAGRASASTRTTRPSQDLLAPASYRAVVDFRWRDARGKTMRTERAISPVCKQPDPRPDLVVRSVRATRTGPTSASVFNRGREAAGAVRGRLPASTASRWARSTSSGSRPQTPVTRDDPAPVARMCGRATRSRRSSTRARRSTRPTRRTTRSTSSAEPLYARLQWEEP